MVGVLEQLWIFWLITGVDVVGRGGGEEGVGLVGR